MRLRSAAYRRRASPWRSTAGALMLSLALLLSLGQLNAADGLQANVAEIARAITELDVERARRLITAMEAESPGLAFQRARLAVYVGDCDAAEAILASIPVTSDSQYLGQLASSCARATAGGFVFEDSGQGVWIRFQDSRDQVLAPYLVAVASASRAALERDLGVVLPRPLRIDLVRDLFSLASVSGLPVDAAETTGTVAVARWGRVTMLSPRAARDGYPWQDTLAHEITHLALSRGSGDFAPLWLQEGIAKREETRWRDPRPFDDQRDADSIARQALVEGNSVGIDRIGPSIAMLPTPQAAGISYAEVESFMRFWIDKNGRPALTLLLADLRGMATRDADLAMQAITGYPLQYWITLWQGHLLSLEQKEAPVEPKLGASRRPAAQAVRLGDLLRGVDETQVALGYFDDALLSQPQTPAVRYRAGAAALALGQGADARERLGDLEDLARLHGAWLGLAGRFHATDGDMPLATSYFELGVAIDPLGEAAACEGDAVETRPGPGHQAADSSEPTTGTTTGRAGAPAASEEPGEPAMNRRVSPAGEGTPADEEGSGALHTPTDKVRAGLCKAARQRLDN